MSAALTPFSQSALLFTSPQKPKLPAYKEISSLTYDLILGYIISKGLIDLIDAEISVSNILAYIIPYVSTRLVNSVNSIFLSIPNTRYEDYFNTIGRVSGALAAFGGGIAASLYKNETTANHQTMAAIGFFSSLAVEKGVNKLMDYCFKDEQPQEINVNLLYRR